jgi:hypothetical protein
MLLFARIFLTITKVMLPECTQFLTKCQVMLSVYKNADIFFN